MERDLEQELRNHIASLTPEQRDVQLYWNVFAKTTQRIH